LKHSHLVYDPLKRVLDVVASAVLLVILSPVLLVVAVLMRIKLGSPVIFAQQRPGKDGHLFTVYKFRSMRTAPASLAADTAVAADAERITTFGRILRSTSLDELPELLNVLAGQMSIVGPRPLLPEYLPRYNAEQARRHEVRPGITGWAQVNGRNAISWDQRFKLDVYYVDHRSLWLDAKILAMTLGAVFGRKGVSAAGHETMHPFDPAAEKNVHKEDS
jgi:lipopolysaccharide/colanic/teichoic acid biosynthesis glycosyltransferase